jgi:late competence protein required for DNA uptake (superfamily II DNA/RNA helicase)
MVLTPKKRETLIAWLEKQGNKDEEILILKDQIESFHSAIKALKEAHKFELEKQGEHNIVCSEEQMKVLDEVLTFAANHESPYWNYYIFGTLNNLIRQLKTESIKL